MRALRLIGPIGYLAVHLEILVLCSVLLGAFGVQFLEGELPCPLCILQRLGMMLAATGAAYMLVKWKDGELSPLDYMTGHGMIILGALGGSFVSIRQILLHIMPGDAGYGDPVLGLHLYSWALVVFVCIYIKKESRAGDRQVRIFCCGHFPLDHSFVDKNQGLKIQ
jgi:disulfide bond formation protein DsbB